MLPLRPRPSLLRSSLQDLFTTLLIPSTRCHAHARAHTSPLPLTTPFKPSTAPQTRRHFASQRSKPRSHDRGPRSEEDTQTDFSTLDVLGNTPAPSTAIDACLWDGFHLDNGFKITGGSGVILVGGEAFGWKPWEADGGLEDGGKRLVNGKGQFEVGDGAWGLLGLVWPKPDLLILGLGKEMRPISPKTRQYINSLGIQIDIQDTRNAAAQFNLLATERGVGSVAAAMIPMGWREGVGVKSSSD